MKLQEFDKYEKITIQCHDNPDADTLASGYGICCYFKEKGKDVRLIYSGHNVIQKANLSLMVEQLDIPIEHVKKSDEKIDGILITVDCQYGAGNVTRLSADDVAIIDHHQIEINDVELSHILPNMGSCSTVVWTMLKEAGYEVNKNEKLATALYYGLLTDTNNFAEARNPIDRDMRDSILYNNTLITMFCNSNISLNELEVAGIALLRCSYNEDFHFAVIKSQPCDANILGLISDFLLQVDKIYSCVVFSETDAGCKLSVRSCVREVNASELAAFLTQDIGNGGGHYQKAGGFISKKLYDEKINNSHYEAYFNNRMVEYFNHFDSVYAEKYEINVDDFEMYHKKNIPVGYVKASDMLPVGTDVTIRTLEGDMDIVIEEDLVIMIGVEGEVYPSRMNKFSKAYKPVDKKYDYEECVIAPLYEPVVINRNTAETILLKNYAKVCVPTGDVNIYAKQLKKSVKVFTSWDTEKYMVGKEGDYLAARTDDLHDIYVVDNNIFLQTYEEI